MAYGKTKAAFSGTVNIAQKKGDKLANPQQKDFLQQIHTVNFCLEMVLAKHVSKENIFCSMNEEKIRRYRIFEIVHFPFDG